MEGAAGDYHLTFSPCRELVGYLIHIDQVSPRILDHFRDPECDSAVHGGRRAESCFKDVSIPVKAGDRLGTVTKASQVEGSSLASFDFGVYDRRNPLPYANPARYEGEHEFLYGACPLDYFAPSVRAELQGRIGHKITREGKGFVPRMAPPVCGEIELDEAGTAQGNWFLKGAPPIHSEDNHLALVHDVIETMRATFSVGRAGLKISDYEEGNGVYYFDPVNSGKVNRHFRQVRSDGVVYCYEPSRFLYRNERTNSIFLVQLTSPMTLRIEEGRSPSCGNGPWEFSGNFSDFER